MTEQEARIRLRRAGGLLREVDFYREQQELFKRRNLPDCVRECANRIESCLDEYQETIRVIAAIPSDAQRETIKAAYLDGLPREVIAEDESVDLRTIYRRLARGCKMFAQVYTQIKKPCELVTG